MYIDYRVFTVVTINSDVQNVKLRYWLLMKMSHVNGFVNIVPIPVDDSV